MQRQKRTRTVKLFVFQVSVFSSFLFVHTDFNECEINEGHGPCEDSCENTPGGFSCSCDIPGYKVDEDGINCFRE